MVRKSKKAADNTRRQLVDAARACFLQYGVAGTTLDMVAKTAGMTRGAVYWHFCNKVELFTAVRDEVVLPLFDPCAEEELCPHSPDAQCALERYFHYILDAISGDTKVFDVLTIMFYKCEYVGDFEKAFAEQKARTCALIDMFEALYAKARQAGKLNPAIDTRIAALETHIFLVGLIRMALIRAHTSAGQSDLRQLVKSHLARIQ